MTILTEIVLILRDIALAIVAALTGNRHLRFEHAIFIAAPRSIVWKMLRAKDIIFEGFVPMRAVSEPVPGRPDLEKGLLRMGQREMIMTTRVAKEQPEEVVIIEVLEDGTDPSVIMGRNDYIGFFLADAANGTKLGFSRELDATKWHAAVSVPLGLRAGARRYKATAERMARTGDDGTVESGPRSGVATTAAPTSSSFGLSRNGILVSLLALASFSFLWGWREALLISAIIILHELGHALAMLMVGVPVKGIYLVPFFGGAAIAGAPYRNEGQSGFVSLMGPGFSLISTMAFAIFARETGSPLFRRATEMSAIINLLNLAPILPLDGGQVLRSVLVSLNKTLALVVGLAGIALGFWAAWTFRDPVLTLFVALGLLVTLQIRKNSAQAPMRWPAALVLLGAFFTVIAAYVGILYASQT